MLKKPLFACTLALFAFLFTLPAVAQKVKTIGVFTGISVPYHWDNGISKDSRYRSSFDIKFSPIGLHLGMEKEKYGFMLDPALIRIGQNFSVINSNGGEAGERSIDLTYVQVPISLKVPIIDMAFFKVSFVGSVAAGILLDANETMRHRSDIYKFPVALTGIYPSAKNQEFEQQYPGYQVQYDGVLAPAVNSKMATLNDYQKIQLFGALGFRSDWDFNDKWRASFDLRGNIGILEPRTSERIDRINNNEALYEMPGARRDLFLSLTFGFARTFVINKRDEVKKSNKKQEFKPHRTTKYPWPKPRNKPPKR